MVLPLLVLPVGTGVFLARHPGLSWLALLVFGLLFALTHVVITRQALTRRRTLAAAGRETARDNPSGARAPPASQEDGWRIEIQDST